MRQMTIQVDHEKLIQLILSEKKQTTADAVVDVVDAVEATHHQ
jgi:hypothetical protein